MRVEDVMTRDVVVGHPQMSLDEIGNVFKEKRISGVPVVNDSGDLVGIVTLTDMLRVLDEIYEWRKFGKSLPELRLAEEFEQKKAEAKVIDIMTRQVHTLEEGCTMEEVMSMMFDKKMHTIPVMKDNKIIGVIGKHDLIAACF